MKSFKHSVVALAAAIALTLSACARQQSNDASDGPIQGMQGMRCPMMQRVAKGGQDIISMMQACRQRMRSMMQPNDRAKLRAPWNEADKGLNPMAGRMNTCMGMMNNMQGMGGMMSGQQNSGDTNSPRP